MTDTEVQPVTPLRTTFESVMFWMLVPGLALAVFVAVLISIVHLLSGPPDSYGMSELIWIATIVFLWILFGSMALRARQLLRHPDSPIDRAIPRANAILHTLIYVVLVCWTVALALGMPEEAGLYFGGILALLACVDQAIVLRRPARRNATLSVERPAPAPWMPGIIAIALVLAVTLSVAGAVTNAFAVATAGVLLVICLGMPWSWPVTTIVAAFFFFGSGALGPVPALTILAIPAVANIVMVWRSTRSQDAYTRAFNRFFRLTGA